MISYSLTVDLKPWILIFVDFLLQSKMSNGRYDIHGEQLSSVVDF
jgi:hypothetical protein